MGENKSKEKGDDEDTNTGKDLSEKQLKKYKRYNISTQMEDKSLHDTDIIDAVFASKIDKLFVAEYKSKKIKIYNPKPGNPKAGKADIFDLGTFFKNEQNKGDKKKMVVDSKQALTFSILSIALCPAYGVVRYYLIGYNLILLNFS